MKAKKQLSERSKQNNRRDFYATCSEAEVKDGGKYLFKHVKMFGDKTLRYWKESGKISTLNGFIH